MLPARLSIAQRRAVLAKIPRPTLLARLACKQLKARARGPITKSPVVARSLWVAEALALQAEKTVLAYALAVNGAPFMRTACLSLAWRHLLKFWF